MNPTEKTGMIRNISALGLGSALVKPVWFIFITYFVAQYLALEGFTTFQLALFWLLIIAEIGDVGLTPYTIREVARRRDQGPGYLNQLLPARTFLTLILALVGLGIAWISGYADGRFAALVWAAVYAVGFRNVEYFRAFFRAHEVLKYESWSLILEKILVVTCGVGFILYLPTAESALSGMALGIWATLIAILFWSRARFVSFSFEWPDVPMIRAAYAGALSLGVLGILAFVSRYNGALLLELLHSSREAGLYTLALRIIEALWLFPMLIVASTLPRFSSLYHEHRQPELLLLLKKTLAISFAVSVLVTILMLLGGSDVIRVFKPEFADAQPVLNHFVLLFPFFTLSTILSFTLISINEQKFLVRLVAVVTLFHVLANVLLIPMWGYMSPVFVWLADNVLLCIVMLIRCRSVLVKNQ